VTLILKDPITTTEKSQTFNQRKNTTGIKDTMLTNRTITYLKSLSEISPPYCYLSRDYVKEELISVLGPCHELHYGNDHHPSQSSLQKKIVVCRTSSKKNLRNEKL
jgi:hypothetical protein